MECLKKLNNSVDELHAVLVVKKRYRRIQNVIKLKKSTFKCKIEFKLYEKSHNLYRFVFLIYRKLVR